MVENFYLDTRGEGLHSKLLWLDLNMIEGRASCKAWLAGLRAYESEVSE